MSIPATLWKVLCGGSCCGCCCAHPGEITGQVFPRNEKELRAAGAIWLTKVLTGNGTLSGGITVTSLDIAGMNEGGLLGEMCVVNVKYSGKTDAPPKLVAKFRPPDTESRITVALFDICQNEFDFYRTVQPTMADIIRVPKMVFGDFHRPSGTCIMLFEFINAEFRRVQDRTPVETSRAMIKQIAALHSTFWGAQYAPASLSFIPAMDEGAASLVPKVAAKKFKTLFTGIVKDQVAQAPSSLQTFLKLLYPNPATLAALMSHFAHIDGWNTVFHGDCRVDNFFFNEKGRTPDAGPLTPRLAAYDPLENTNIGLLDWQLMNRGFCGADLSWYYTTTVDADDAGSAELLALYYAELGRARARVRGAAPLPSIEEFREEVALVHIFSFSKCIIGAGGLDKNDANTVDVMRILTRRCLKAMEVHGTMAAFAKFRSGELLSQVRSGAGGASGPGPVATGALEARLETPQAEV